MKNYPIATPFKCASQAALRPDAVNHFITTGCDPCVFNESGSATAITQAAFNIFGNPTSIESECNRTEIAIYPNPGSDYIFFLNTESVQSINFKNITGKECFQLEKPNGRINMKQLSSGIYFYEIITENGSRKNGKWIKK